MKKRNIILVLIGCSLFAIVASFIASQHPDGLERVAERLGFLGASEGKEALTSPMPDYEIPAIKNDYLSGPLAAVIGTAITFIVAFLAGRLIKRKK